jgi:ATP adenylyltransferase
MSYDNLWAPWRLSYLQQIEPDHTLDPKNAGAAASKEPPCFLCDARNVAPAGAEARRRLVLLQDSRGLLMLNLYPYTNGHLLVAPNDHLADLPDLPVEQRAGLMELTVLGERLLQAAINPQGFNVGINLGRSAGAGVPGHLQIHIVPRWSGDTNFMQVIGQVRVIPQALEESYALLSGTLAKMTQ